MRFPHALVMAVLFGKGAPAAQAERVARATWTHARNLAAFVTLYKALAMGLGGVVGGKRGAKSPLAAFVAGGLAGGVVFGKNEPINMQIVLYLLSRVTVAAAREGYNRYREVAPVAPGTVDDVPRRAFLLLASGVWALVMCQFAHDETTLQKSLASSMRFLYRDSDSWPRGWKDFVPGM